MAAFRSRSAVDARKAPASPNRHGPVAAFRSRSAVDARKAPASPNGHGPVGRLSVAASAGGPSRFAAKREKVFPSSFPPSPPSFPQRAFTGGRVRDARRPAPKTNEAWTVFFALSNEITWKICVDRPWNIFSVKRFAFQTIRPVVSQKNAVFPLAFGWAALCCPPRVLPFSSARRFHGRRRGRPQTIPLPSPTSGLRPCSGPGRLRT